MRQDRRDGRASGTDPGRVKLTGSRRGPQPGRSYAATTIESITTLARVWTFFYFRSKHALSVGHDNLIIGVMTRVRKTRRVDVSDALARSRRTCNTRCLLRRYRLTQRHPELREQRAWFASAAVLLRATFMSATASSRRARRRGRAAAGCRCTQPRAAVSRGGGDPAADLDHGARLAQPVLRPRSSAVV